MEMAVASVGTLDDALNGGVTSVEGFGESTVGRPSGVLRADSGLFFWREPVQHRATTGTALGVDLRTLGGEAPAAFELNSTNFSRKAVLCQTINIDCF